jgi:hypothetical protein
MFEKSLQDLVKGLRAIKGDATGYVAKCIAEIRDELKSRDILIKTQALQKLCYVSADDGADCHHRVTNVGCGLGSRMRAPDVPAPGRHHRACTRLCRPPLQLNMLGHDMSWAAFHVIEVMSQERFGLKRIGFGAASQSFTPATDVIVLCTALLKKEFSARSQYEIGLAINCLSNIATEDLSRDLLGDVVTMLTSSRPYIRKKATLLLFKLYLRYPQGLRLTFDNLKRRLTDDNPSVVSCAVNVVCELARKKPSNYLSLAPDLFSLLTTSTNNWMLIKVAKLMSALVQEEPRLARKLLEPLANIVQVRIFVEPQRGCLVVALFTVCPDALASFVRCQSVGLAGAAVPWLARCALQRCPCVPPSPHTHTHTHTYTRSLSPTPSLADHPRQVPHVRVRQHAHLRAAAHEEGGRQRRQERACRGAPVHGQAAGDGAGAGPEPQVPGPHGADEPDAVQPARGGGAQGARAAVPGGRGRHHPPAGAGAHHGHGHAPQPA